MQIILFLHLKIEVRKWPENRADGTSVRFDRFYAILGALNFNISDCQKKPMIYDK